MLCLDLATGKIAWDKSLAAESPETPYGGGRVNLHGYASATPVTDGQSLYVFFGKSGVLKYALDGKLLWKVNVGTAVDSHQWGSAASPILYKDLLIVNASCESQSIRALNKATGEEVWQVGGIVDSWSTPLVVTTKAGGENWWSSSGPKSWGWIRPRAGSSGCVPKTPTTSARRSSPTTEWPT